MTGITPNVAISYILDSNGGRASDIFIVNNTGFLNFLQPGGQVMADRGFKIQVILNFHQCMLCIPPSKHTNLQMTKEDAAKTSKIAIVRIYVEEANKRMKDFKILSNELQILMLPLADDIIKYVSLTSWGEGASLALVGHPSSDGVTIKMPYRVDVLHRPASHPTFSYWVG